MGRHIKANSASITNVSFIYWDSSYICSFSLRHIFSRLSPNKGSTCCDMCSKLKRLLFFIHLKINYKYKNPIFIVNLQNKSDINYSF